MNELALYLDDYSIDADTMIKFKAFINEVDMNDDVEKEQTIQLFEYLLMKLNTCICPCFTENPKLSFGYSIVCALLDEIKIGHIVIETDKKQGGKS